MKSKLWKQVSTSSALAALALAAFLSLPGQTANAQAANPARGQSGSGKKLVGAWHVTVQLYDCTSGAPLGPPFVSLLTFNRGGTMTGSTSNPGFAPGQRGPDHGTWRHTAANIFTASSVAFINFTTDPNPPNPGFEAGSQALSQVIEFTEGSDEFTSDAAIEFFDTTGLSYRQGCASAAGQRLK